MEKPKCSLPMCLLFAVRGPSLAYVSLEPSLDFRYLVVTDEISVANQPICPQVHMQIDRWVDSYLSHVHPPLLPCIDLSPLPSFTQTVLRTIATIPFGSTASYREIAIQVGKKDAARAIGNICKHNPFPFVIPCHRVIQTSGHLGGFAYGIAKKALLLEFEAHAVSKKESFTKSSSLRDGKDHTLPSDHIPQ